MMDRFVYVDTETTDKQPGQIAQLAYVLVDGDAVVDTGNHYFSVGKMSPGAEAIHHLSRAVLRGLSSGEGFCDHLCDFGDAFLSDRVFVAHNARFDLNFVKAEFLRCGIAYDPAVVVCTMLRMTTVCRLKGQFGKFKWPKVEEVLRWLKIDQEAVLTRARELFSPGVGSAGIAADWGFHDARYDVTAVMLIHQWLRRDGR